MDEDEVNPDDTEIWDAPELPDHLDDVEHEAPEVSPVPEFTPESVDPETAFETPEFEAPEADELAAVTPVESSDDFAHEPAVFETESAEDLPGVSFETEEIPEYLDDVGTEVADVTEVDDAEPEVTELDERLPEIDFAADVVDGAFNDPDLAAPEVTTSLESPRFAVDEFPRQFPGPGWRTRDTYWMGR